MLRPGAQVTLVPDKAVAGGWMLGRHDGQVVLVSGAIPGERSRISIDRATRDVAYAHVVDVLEPSTDRRGPSVRWPCGGNAYAHVVYERQLELKIDIVRDALKRTGRVTFDGSLAMAPSQERGYRMRARFHAGPSGFGFYREGTHALCNPAESGQLLDETAAIVGELSGVVRANRLDGITALELAENRGATERAIHVEGRALDATRLGGLAVPGVSGMSVTTMGDPGAIVVQGSPVVSDDIEVDEGDRRVVATVRRGARSFFQGNRFLLTTLVNRVVRWTSGDRVVDLYAGVGLFATALAAGGRAVVAVEGDAVSSADLQRNAAPYGEAFQAVHAPVEEFLRRRTLVEGSTAIADPPRTGLSAEAREHLSASRLSRLIYVSCDAATLARDLRSLVGAGYGLTHIEAFDLFPNTAHVEILAVLDGIHARV